MFTAYFDDSGTDERSDIAVAACYISTKRGWDNFVNEWDSARWEEGFDFFHMAEFLAPQSQGEKPWCDWDNTKKDHVYNRLAKIINQNKRVGIGVAIPKAIWDGVPDWIRGHYGYQHYTFAVRMCMTQIGKWHTASPLSIRYTFDFEMAHNKKRKEISKLLELITTQSDQRVANLLGLEPRGFSFEHKEEFKPLQSADILAWQMRSYMRKIWPLGKEDISLCHPGFKLLRQDQVMNLGFFTGEQINTFVGDHEKLLAQGFPFPRLYESPQFI